MSEPLILRQREVEAILQDKGLRYREARWLVALDVIPRTDLEGCSHRRWLRVDVIAFDAVAYLRQHRHATQGQASNPPRASAAATASCP